jgi:predicted nucleotidyltransferase
MVDVRTIRSFVRKIADEFSPERVVLFGSYARGTPSDDSDVDLLVVMTHNKRNVDQSLDITRRVDRTFPLDLIVRKPEEIQRRLRQHDMFLASILNEGKTLYERSHD